MSTMSISSAPLFNASVVSNTFTAVVFAPKGNPMTQAALTSVPFNCGFTNGIQHGFTITVAKSYAFASSTIF